jgi:hypothetical protein
MPAPKAISYSEEIRQQDTDKARETVLPALYPNEAKPLAMDFGGKCPRCAHAIQSRLWFVTVSAILELNDEQKEAMASRLLEGADLSHGDQHFDLTCSCGEPHLHRPDGKVGCGARFRVHVTWP